MGRKLVSTRVRQRKKPFRKKSGGQKSIHQRGRRWCMQCGRSHGVERRLRRAVHDSLAPLRGRQAKCPADCECVMCVGDLNGIARFGERRLDQW